jgi:pyruvate kinase
VTCCCLPAAPQDEHNARKTKIVCTLGPSCWSEAGLGALMDAGMNVARLNFSHGDHTGHGEVGSLLFHLQHPHQRIFFCVE